MLVVWHTLKNLYLRILCKLFHFHKWHITPAKERPYAVFLIKKINRMYLKEGMIIELGCGLGDILSEIKKKKKVGYDIDSSVIRAAKFVHPFLKTRVGTFQDIKNKKISMLITVNFVFSLEEKVFQKGFSDIISQNKIDRIVIDEVPCPPYTYRHNYIQYFKSMGYFLEYKSRGFEVVGGRRYLLFFKKMDEAI